ncbi:MAG TPA: hypothetical protein VFO74_16455, partial [Pseudolabrys sp.]|nr:hypothetical protein [Pseudolabrys sp.]
SKPYQVTPATKAGFSASVGHFWDTSPKKSKRAERNSRIAVTFAARKQQQIFRPHIEIFSALVVYAPRVPAALDYSVLSIIRLIGQTVRPTFHCQLKHSLAKFQSSAQGSDVHGTVIESRGRGYRPRQDQGISTAVSRIRTTYRRTSLGSAN